VDPLRKDFQTEPNCVHRLMDVVTSSHDLIERVKAGDQEAFAALFNKYRRRMAVLIHFRLSPELRSFAEVDDVLQEAWLRAFRDFGQFTYRSPGSFMSWLARIADHVIADLARSQGRQKRHAAEMLRFRSESNPGGPEPLDSKTPSRLLAQEESLRRLVDKLNALPEDYRQAILLMKVEGLSTSEAAERLGKSKEATALLLHRAIKRFRALEEPSGN
jgi:RNA polymerase sigma-70 factor (subfamily 1)